MHKKEGRGQFQECGNDVFQNIHCVKGYGESNGVRDTLDEKKARAWYSPPLLE